MHKLDILRQLREMKQLSQVDMATYFGFSEAAGRIRVGKWERGDEVPPLKHRARFISYLLDELALRDNLDYFIQIWKILVETWEWPDVTDPELVAYRLQENGLSDIYGYLFTNDPRMSQNYFSLKKESVTIGRLYGCDLVVPIDCNRVSKVHALIFRNHGRAYIKDMNSTLGTYINGVQIGEDYLLEDGQIVTLGANKSHETIFTFVFLVNIDIESTASAL